MIRLRLGAPPTRRRLASRGAWFLVLFSVPFVGFGLLALVQATEALGARDWRQAGMLGVFGLVFGGSGAGIAIGGLVGSRRASEAAALRERHPAEPWRWRADWASGRIRDASRAGTVFAWLFAAFWNLISLPVAVFAVPPAVRNGEYAALAALIFPVVGAGLVVWAVRSTLHRRKFGTSLLELARVPGVIGGSLGGNLLARLPAGGAVDLTLTCVRRITTGSGKHRSTREEVLWQDDRSVTGHPIRRADGMWLQVPVEFRLPGDASASDDSDPNDRIVWRLGARAELDGLDYHASFEVPVFRTAESEAAEIAGDGAQAPAAAVTEPPEPTIVVSPGPTGVRFEFPPARHKGVAATLTVFWLIWSGITAGLLLFGAPLLFGIVFGIFALLLLFGVLRLWFGATTVEIGPEGAAVHDRTLGIGGTRRIPAREVADVEVKIGMQANGRAFYDLRLRDTRGRRTAAGGMLRDRREAEWLASRMRDALRSTG